MRCRLVDGRRGSETGAGRGVKEGVVGCGRALEARDRKYSRDEVEMGFLGRFGAMLKSVVGMVGNIGGSYGGMGAAWSIKKTLELIGWRQAGRTLDVGSCCRGRKPNLRGKAVIMFRGRGIQHCLAGQLPRQRPQMLPWMRLKFTMC